MNPTFLEKIPIEIFSDEGNNASIKVAHIIAEKIKNNNSLNKNTVLGLATGKTPLDVYRELIQSHEKGLDFSRVITFNLDEYYGLKPEHVNSYHRFMLENFFDFVNIKKQNIHIPNGMVEKSKIPGYCRKYEKAIKKAGGIDIQLLGIGKDGHIGFNEPGSSLDSRTRLVNLDKMTRKDVMSDFGELRYVPEQAITMGVATILEAEQIILIATGNHKAKIVVQAVEGSVTKDIAASYLQTHQNTSIFLDRAAASELTRLKKPWIVYNMDWSGENIRAKALCFLSEQTGKPFHKLEKSDFVKYSLSSLYDNFRNMADEVIKDIKNKIKDSNKLPKGKRILIFSPHPDDDIISMGGTLRKLVENKNMVYVAYMTSGYNAVFDYAVINFITSTRRFSSSFGVSDKNEKLYKKLFDFLAEKRLSKYGMIDIPEVLKIKQIIREVEAISTTEFVGVAGYDFLNLPFYQTGMARKLSIGEKDINIVKKKLEKYKPDIIFAAGDLTDPNGTHRLCLDAVYSALKKTKKRPELWLYKGAWQEFHPTEADVLVPLSPDELVKKRLGIFRHESQKDMVPQPGHEETEFWQRAEKRNKSTAGLLESYGIEGYYAMEAFKRNS